MVVVVISSRRLICGRDGMEIVHGEHLGRRHVAITKPRGVGRIPKRVIVEVGAHVLDEGLVRIPLVWK